MAVNLSPVFGAGAQLFDNNGVPLAGGLIYTYAAGTSTSQAAYTSGSGLIQHSNPIVLDASGRVPGGEIWLSDGVSYKFVVETSTFVLIGSYDNLVGINSNFVAFTSQEESQTATQGQTVFTLTIIQYQPGTNNLLVFVNGSKQISGTNYTETSSTVITFVDGLNVGDIVDFTTATPIATNATNSDNVSYNEGGTGAVTRNVRSKLQESVSILDFGADPTGVADSYTAITEAIAASNSIYIPVGNYKISSTIVIPNHKYVYGAGRYYSVLIYNGVGNGIEIGNNPVNGSGYGQTTISNFEIRCINSANMGAGIALNAGGYSYYEIDLMYSSYFFYGIVIDQAEVSHITRSNFETRENLNGACMWITNGPEWRAGGLQRYTNDITVENCSFNQGKYNIFDDGGNVHTFIGNSLNGATYGGVHFSGVTGLLFTGHAWETGNNIAGTTNLFFSTLSAVSGALTGTCNGAQITANTFSAAASTDAPMISFPSGNLPLYHSGFNITGNYFIGTIGGGPAAIDVSALSESFCGFNYDTGPAGAPRPHYTGIHNDANGNVLYPPSGNNNNDSTLPFSFGNTGNFASFSGGFGYGNGAGGTVTQTTNKGTAVTLNKMCGKITTNNAALAGNAVITFLFNNSYLDVNDMLIINVNSSGIATEGSYQVWADVGVSGQAIICLKNITSGSLSESVKITFGVIKGLIT